MSELRIPADLFLEVFILRKMFSRRGEVLMCASWNESSPLDDRSLFEIISIERRDGVYEVLARSLRGYESRRLAFIDCRRRLIRYFLEDYIRFALELSALRPRVRRRSWTSALMRVSDPSRSLAREFVEEVSSILSKYNKNWRSHVEINDLGFDLGSNTIKIPCIVSKPMSSWRVDCRPIDLGGVKDGVCNCLSIVATFRTTQFGQPHIMSIQAQTVSYPWNFEGRLPLRAYAFMDYRQLRDVERELSRRCDEVIREKSWEGSRSRGRYAARVEMIWRNGELLGEILRIIDSLIRDPISIPEILRDH